ncbi:MAG: hypothetical protein ACLPSW_21170, partial [Roseiarcus sp.]
MERLLGRDRISVDDTPIQGWARMESTKPRQGDEPPNEGGGSSAGPPLLHTILGLVDIRLTEGDSPRAPNQIQGWKTEASLGSRYLERCTMGAG